MSATSRTKRYYVYILANEDRSKTYIGVSNNVWRRRSEHRGGQTKGYAHTHKCFDVIYMEEFIEVADAIIREKQIKSFNRAKKFDLIRKENPELTSLKSPSEKQAEWLSLSHEERLKRIMEMPDPTNTNKGK